MDIVDLQNFYLGDLGKSANRLILRAIRQQWPDLSQCNLLGLGFATPYLNDFEDEASCMFALMPARQGVIRWGRDGKNRVALTEDTHLPLPDNSVDRIIIVHGLEMTNRPRTYLREVWRVLQADGRVIFVVPNRSGIWARMDTTPFGHGRPFSQSQMLQLLRENMFLPLSKSGALYIPPTKSEVIMGSALAFEKFGQWARAGLGGVNVIEATKQVYAIPPQKAEKRKRFKEIIIPSRKDRAPEMD